MASKYNIPYLDHMLRVLKLRIGGSKAELLIFFSLN